MRLAKLYLRRDQSIGGLRRLLERSCTTPEQVNPPQVTGLRIDKRLVVRH